jgi:hypothetical protein
MCAQGVNLVGVCNQTAANSILAGNCFNMTTQDVARYPSMYFTLWNNDNKVGVFCGALLRSLTLCRIILSR